MKKKAPFLHPVNHAVVAGCWPAASTVEGRSVEAAAGEERGSCVGSTAPQRWVWPASEHLTGVGLASVWGTRAEAVCEHWPAVLKPCGLVHFYPAAAGGYEGHLPGVDHTVGKLHRQQLDRNHLRLRTRLKRLAGKTLGFSKSVLIHDIVIGLFVNRYEFGNLV